MLIFIYGSDNYRIKQTRDELINRYKAKYESGFNFYSLDLSDASDEKKLEEALKNTSFFKEHKLISCKNIFSKKTSAEFVFNVMNESGIASDKEVTVIVSEDLAEKDMRAKHPKLLKLLSNSSGAVKKLEPLSGIKLSDWVKNEFKKRNCTIKDSALANLISVVGNNSWDLVNEIDKLSAYKSAGEIMIEDIALLTITKNELNIFSLIDAIGSQNRKKIVELLYQELKTGRDPYYILTMIAHQFRTLINISDLLKRGLNQQEIIKKTGLHPFVIKKNSQIITNLNGKINFKKIYSDILSIDTLAKSGHINLEDSLYKIALS